MRRPLVLAALLLALDVHGQPQVPRDVFVVIGQSLAAGASTQNQDAYTGHVTSPAANGLISRSYRNGYPTYGEAGWILANDWPCADSQCTGTECTGANRTAAGHPDWSSTDGDGTCVCDCGVTTASRNGWEKGSPWPAFAEVWMAERNREVDFIPTTVGDSCLVVPGGSPSGEPLWDSTIDCSTVTDTLTNDERGDLWCAMKRSIANSGETPTAFLWAQGECDTWPSLPATKAQYKTALTALVDNIWASYERPTVLSILGSHTNVIRHGGGTCGALPSTWAPIRDAQIEVIAENPHAFLGASYDDIELESDCTHVYDNETWGVRWADAVQAAGILSRCDDGLDNDGDGLTDTADPGCFDATWPYENPECSDGVDNDGDGNIDWDGAGVGPADAQCAAAYGLRENPRPIGCGLGAEVTLLLPFVGLAARRLRRN